MADALRYLERLPVERGIRRLARPVGLGQLVVGVLLRVDDYVVAFGFELAASPSRTGTEGTKTTRSHRAAGRTNRPTACAKNSAVDTLVAYTPTASRGTSTPSDTIRTATIQRSSDMANFAIFLLAVGSSDSTTTGRAPLTRRSSAAYARAVSWSLAMTSPAGVGNLPPHFGEPPVGGLKHPLDPLAARVERGPPGLRDLLPRHRRAERRGYFIAGPGPPGHLAGIRQEDHRPHHAIGERGPVSVHEVRRRPLDAVRLWDVRDERNRIGIRAERRTRERQAASRRTERFAHSLAPGQRVASVVDLIEDHQRTTALGSLPVQRRMGRDLRVRDRYAVKVGTDRPLGVAVSGIDRDAVPGSRLRPLET